MRNIRRSAVALFLMAMLAWGSAQTLGLSVSTLNNPFFVTLRDGVQAAAEEAGLELITVDAQDSVSKQLSDIEDLVQRGVDVLIINATDSDAVVPAVLAANAAGIPVIAVDRAASGGEVAYFVASDNIAGGALAAAFMCEALEGNGLVVELEGIPGVSATRERGQGFNDYLAENCSGLEIIARQTANFNRGEGLSVMENILVAQPEIDAVFAHNDEMALGALQAIEALGSDILVIGFDATDDAVEAVDACRLAATVAQLPENLGREAVQASLLLLENPAPESTENIAVALELVSNPDCF